MNALNKFMYFAVAGDNATAYPVSSLRGIDTAANKLHLYFTPHRISDVATGDAVDHITLSCGADESVALQNVVEAINMTVVGVPFVVISDSEKGKHVTGVTACDSIVYAT